MKRSRPILIVLALALLSGWPLWDAGLTAPAQQLFGPEATSGWISDGVAVWRDWMPLSGSWGLESLQGERLLSLALWVALLGALYQLSCVVGLSPWARVLAVALVAAHPLSVPLAGDLATRGLLASGTLMVLTTVFAWRREGNEPPDRRRLAAIFIASLLACLAHPIALLLPVILGLTSWLAPSEYRGQRVQLPSLFAVLVPAATVLVVRWAKELPANVDLTRHGAALQGEVPPLAGLNLVGQSLMGLSPAQIPIRRPCDVDLASAGASEPLVWLGGLALLAIPMVTRRLASPGLSLGLWWLWAVLVACSQIAEPLPSELAPGLLALGWVGAAVALATALDRDQVRQGSLALAVAVGVLMVPDARHAFSSEREALDARVRACPDAIDPRVQLARHVVTQGDGRKALELLEGLEGESVTETRFEIHLARRSWGPIRRELRSLSGDAALTWRCRAGSAMSELYAVPACAKAREALGDLPDLVAAHVVALARDRRVKEAEELARAQVELQPDQAVLWDALVTVLEKAGWMRQAVEALEQWHASEAGSEHVKLRLGAALVNKGKGDLVQGRAEEAKKTFVRGLELQPKRHELRYHLARALRDLGDLEGAKREHQRAVDSGAEEPASPLQMRDMPRIP